MPKGETGSLIDSPELRGALLDMIEHGVPISTASRALGLRSNMVWDWTYCAEHGCWRTGIVPVGDHLEIIRQFCLDLQTALAKLEATLVSRLYEAGGRENGKTGLLDWRPNSFLLNNHPRFRETWHPKQNTNIQVALPRTRSTLEDKTDAELIDLAGEEWREILEPRQLPEGPDAAQP